MPVKVSCPHCSKELNAPDELVGQLVACPRCNKRFHVKIPTAATAAAAQAAENLLPPSATPPLRDSVLPPPATSDDSSSSANLERISLGNIPAPPPTTVEPASQPPGAVPANAPSRMPPSHDSTQTAPSASGSVATESATAAATPASGNTARFKGAPSGDAHEALPTANPVRKKREVKQARFVASGAVSTRINLGEDGQLPQLVVADAKKTDDVADQDEQSGSPMLMVGVLIFSVLVSVVMLTLPDGSKQKESTSKQDAIAHIEEYYIGLGKDLVPDDELKPYQQLLRQGLQALRRGDDNAARSAFRRVLGMLRAETNSNRGVTTEFKWAEFPPNDRDLETHLNVLLADD